MKFEVTKDWCLKMARLEHENGTDVEIGAGLFAADPSTQRPEYAMEESADPRIAFGRFVRLMRRGRQQTLEKLAEAADIDVTELVEIEEDSHYRPEPRTVFQLAGYFAIPSSKLMQLAGLSQQRDSHLANEAIRFAARSEKVTDLNETERSALEAFVAVLSEQK
ncbi:helix-turn-helix domain-containing protein [Paraburkholderia phenazinium]|uniref:Helix-turn-helix domain-containing protein n=1 Tax=Paraburkholderia phenazinium TaxID=60549 RepID=A0A1N6JB09_9BURK|nr:helix-turn-helix transcriptional regulator [Paraburkholderia phenazinium]SIO41544.1 Helix-turn-helix domain-containing protein [Paraburkholderia phenazinium]